jgi:gas vesicle protein
MDELNKNTSSEIVISSQTDTLVEREMVGQSADLKQETKELIEAIKKRAQSEIQTAQDLTREGYLAAVRRAREAIEQAQLIDSDRVEQAVQMIQQDAQKNWQTVADEITSLGDRLTEAAKAAWNVLTQPRSKSK